MAIFLVRQRDAAHILADGAAVAPDGKIVGAVAKIMPLPHLGAAIALRGDVEMTAQLPLLGLAHDLAELRHLGEECLRTIRAASREAELYVASLEGCFAVTAAGTTEIESFALAPADRAICADLSFLYGRTADMVDAEVDGLKIMEVLRRHPVRGANGAIIRLGGHVQIASVTPAGITTRILRGGPTRSMGRGLAAACSLNLELRQRPGPRGHNSRPGPNL
jgi:hypothetical protein